MSAYPAAVLGRLVSSPRSYCQFQQLYDMIRRDNLKLSGMRSQKAEGTADSYTACKMLLGAYLSYSVVEKYSIVYEGAGKYGER